MFALPRTDRATCRGAGRPGLAAGTSGVATTSFYAPGELISVFGTGLGPQVGVNAQAGSNSWVWNGQDNSGNTMPDGAYGIALDTGTSGSNAAALTFSVVGTATGLQNTSSGMQLDLGALQVPMSSVQSLAK